MGKNSNVNSVSPLSKRYGTEKKYLQIITRLYVILILAVFPLYTGMNGYDNIVYNKAQYFWIVSISFLLIFSLFYTVYYFGLKIGERPEKFYKTMSVADWSVLSYIVCITISLILSEYNNVAFWGEFNRYDGWFSYFLMLIVYFPVSRWYKINKNDIIIFSIGAILVCLIGILQYYDYDFLKLFPYDRGFYTDEFGNPLHSGFTISFRTTIGNRDFLSAYVCIMISIFGISYIKTNDSERYLYFLTTLLLFFLMTIGASDSSILGVSGSIILIMSYLLDNKKYFSKFLILLSSCGFLYCLHHWFMINIIMPSWPDTSPLNSLILRDNYEYLPLNYIFLISFILLIIGVIFLFFKYPVWPKEKTMRVSGFIITIFAIICGFAVVELIGDRFEYRNHIFELRELLHGRIKDEYFKNRAFPWIKAIEIFKENPFFGTGPDTFYYALGEDTYSNGENFDKVHNDFLQILACNGVFALLSYLTALTALFIKSYKQAFTDKYTLIIVGAVFSYLIQSLFGIDTIIVKPIFWLFLAILRNIQVNITNHTNI